MTKKKIISIIGFASAIMGIGYSVVAHVKKKKDFAEKIFNDSSVLEFVDDFEDDEVEEHEMFITRSSIEKGLRNIFNQYSLREFARVQVPGLAEHPFWDKEDIVDELVNRYTDHIFEFATKAKDILTYSDAYGHSRIMFDYEEVFLFLYCPKYLDEPMHEYGEEYFIRPDGEIVSCLYCLADYDGNEYRGRIENSNPTDITKAISLQGMINHFECL